MSDNVSVEAVKQAVHLGNGNHGGFPWPMASEAPAASQQDLAQWQQVMQAYYKQQQQQPQGQQTAFYPAAAHPYAGFFAGQPLMYGAPFYGGIVPYAYPAPAAAGAQGSESAAKVEKAVSSQPTAVANGASAASASLPPRGNQTSQTQRLNMHSKASSNSLNALAESGQYAKQSPTCTPPASPVQPQPAEPSKEKILHASDAEGIKAEGQAAAMAAIAAAQAQVNGQGRDDTRANSGEYWVRSNSEEDMERADSGGLQDEREVKRQRRKQSNRESARRSRLRKQAECEALAVRVNELMNENVKLRAANEQLLKLQHLTSHQAPEISKAQ